MLRRVNLVIESRMVASTGDRIQDWPAEHGFSARYVEAADGTRLRTLVRGPEGAPRVVFVHGFPQSAACWRAVAARLSDDAFRLIAFDLRGYAGSELARSGRYDLDTLADDLERVLSTPLGGSEGPALLAAHDWGGPVAWHALGRRPELVRGHVSMNAPHFSAYARALRESGEQRRRGQYTAVFQIPGFEHLIAAGGAALVAWMLRVSSPPGLFTDEDLELYLAPMRDPARARAALAYYREGARLLLRTGGVPDAPLSSVPTILLWGQRDAALVGSFPESIRDHYCPSAEVRRLETSHWVPEEAPDAVAEAIRDVDRRTRR